MVFVFYFLIIKKEIYTITKEDGMKNGIRKIIIFTAIVLGVILALLIGFILFLSITEFKPGAAGPVPLENNPAILPETGKTVSVLSMNIGYGSLDKNQDFFMDGGNTIRPDSDKNVKANMKEIRDFFLRENADVYFLQEVDAHSRRSYYMNQVEYLAEGSPGSTAFAYNFKVRYVPIPLKEPIGRVESGLLMMNRFRADKAERVSLPVPFTWPVRTANLKRCILVERVPVKDSGRELVLVNLHLEAYDDGEGKAAQTRVLMDLLNAEYAKGNYCIAGGDFNQTFPGVDHGKFPIIDTDFFTPGTLSPEMLNPGWQFAFDGNTPSCRLLNKPYSGTPAGNQFYIIDGFIISPNVELVSVRTIDMNFAYSDHNPVRLEARLK